MLKFHVLWLTAACFALSAVAPAETFVLGEANGIVAPSTRGSANTTFFGWDAFGNDGDGIAGGVIDDTTPDIGLNPGGVRIFTTNGEDHTPFNPDTGPGSAGNLYTFTGSVAEHVIVTTSGVVGTGFTTIIVQAISAAQGNPTLFSGIPVFSDIDGVTPTLIHGLNANGIEQLLARWDLTGNQTTYDLDFSGPINHYSNDKFVVDTHWSATGFQPDQFTATPEPGRAMLAVLGLLGMAFRRHRSA